ncbi:trypsin-like peptidase domain-containing protein [bacterium]|nr:trypsin-like peptidase domain-containing protein [bacterium]
MIRFALLSLVIVALLTGLAPAQQTEVVLRNGSMVRADLLQRTDDRLVFDLGFEVLSVPVDSVAEERAAGEEAPEAAMERDETRPLPSSAEPGVITGDIDDITEDLKQAIVVVSNPGGFGAGFIIDPSGLILTNHHVVRGENRNDVTVFLRNRQGKPEKKEYEDVEVRAFSSLMDCALLKIPEDQLDGPLPALLLAPPEIVRTSLRVYAIGNPGVGRKMLEHSVTQGIISSTNRNFNDVLYLQTTAAVNPGNSGGPLVDSQGRVIGLVTFRAVFQEGLAFALPVWYLHHFVENAKAYSPSGEEQNTGYRYHDPMPSFEEEKR